MFACVDKFVPVCNCLDQTNSTRSLQAKRSLQHSVTLLTEIFEIRKCL